MLRSFGPYFKFLSTPSARRATVGQSVSRFTSGISIHALREEGDDGVIAGQLAPVISIHALREEGDTSCRSVMSSYWNFYPRPPRGGRRQSRICRRCCTGNFYPRPPRGGRLCNAWSHGVAIGISIHALREEGDLVSCCTRRGVMSFLSTPSARRATMPLFLLHIGFHISIHALREEGDSSHSQ